MTENNSTFLEKNISDKFNKDEFWLNDYRILFYSNRLTEFFPTIQMTLVEKLNAIFRLSIYLSILLYLLTNNYLYLYIMIIIGIFTTFIYYNQKDNIELYFNSINNSDDNIIVQREIDEKTNIEPSTENPFMNINLITDNKEKEQAPKSWNNTDLQKEIENKFNYNLYRDVGDLYGKSNSQREYYTMPSTTIPNEQTAFAKWCYSVGPTCKEDSIYCSPEMPQVPYISTTDVYLGTNVKY
jgi:hypothetical protein